MIIDLPKTWRGPAGRPQSDDRLSARGFNRAPKVQETQQVIAVDKNPAGAVMDPELVEVSGILAASSGSLDLCPARTGVPAAKSLRR